MCVFVFVMDVLCFMMKLIALRLAFDLFSLFRLLKIYLRWCERWARMSCARGPMFCAVENRVIRVNVARAHRVKLRSSACLSATLIRVQ